MKENIIKYYLPVFGFTLLFVIPSLIKNYDSEKVYDIVIAMIVICITLTLILGTIYLKIGNEFLEKYQRKKLKKPFFQDFKKLGFVENDKSLVGKNEDYTIFITPQKHLINGEKWIEIQILFSPKIGSSFIPQYIFDELFNLKKGIFTWYSNLLVIKIKYGLKFPKSNIALKLITEGISIMKRKNIEAISIKEWKSLSEENEVFYKQKDRLYNR